MEIDEKYLRQYQIQQTTKSWPYQKEILLTRNTLKISSIHILVKKIAPLDDILIDNIFIVKVRGATEGRGNRPKGG